VHSVHCCLFHPNNGILSIFVFLASMDVSECCAGFDYVGKMIFSNGLYEIICSTFYRVTTSLEYQQMSGNLTCIQEMLEN